MQTKHPAFTQSIIALSTFKYKLKNFLLYVAIFLGMNTPVFAEKFTNADFLQLPDEAKKFWIQGAMYAMSATVTRNNAEQGKCIIDWYFSDKRSERNGLIIASMEKYPKHSPSVIFLVLTENACGKF